MNHLITTLAFLVGLYTVAALPKYIVIPHAGAEVIESNPRLYAEPSHVRITRRSESDNPVPHRKIDSEEVEPAPRIEQASARLLDYVDFGGHTGTNGAFGWYADFPAHR